MKNTIFDLADTELSTGKKGFFEAAERAPNPKDNSFLSSVSDYGKTILKGAAEGLGRLGRVMGPLQTDKSTSEQLEEQTESLDKLLPVEEDFGQRSIRRGLRELPTALSFPGSTAATLPRAIAAGFLGEGAKDLGAPEWAQTAAELTAYIGPDITKKLLESGKDKDLIQAGRKLGMSDEALTPLLQSEFKQKWLSKMTPRRGSTQSSLSKSKSELQKTYGELQKSSAAQGELSFGSSQGLINSIEDKLFEMPSGVRSKISADFKDLQSRPITGDSLINFYVDINHEAGKNAKQLSLLKEPIKNALKEINPSLAKDFDTINTLYSKYYPIAKRLEPNLMTDIVGASEAIGLLASLTTGYYPFFLKIAGEKTARKVAQQLLINPRFQQISKKMVVAMNQNKYQMVKKLSDLMSHEMRKTSPEVADKLDDISEEELMDLFKIRREIKEQ